MTIMSQQRNNEMKETFCCSLGPIPWAFANSMGTLKKTNKVILMHELDKNIESSEEVLYILVSQSMVWRWLEKSKLMVEEFALKLLNAIT